jgi:transcriptional regulator with XRE-family HTH domain
MPYVELLVSAAMRDSEDESDPAVVSPGDRGLQRRMLVEELRKLRASAGLTQSEVAERLEWSLSKVGRIEKATVGTSVTDLRAMLDLYSVTDPELAERLTEAARHSKDQAWWSPYRAVVSPQYAQYLAHEGAASLIRVYHPFLIPGLLQTREYASALREPLADEQTGAIVELRTARLRNLLTAARPPRIELVLGQEALYRLIGGPAVMRAQLEHVRELSARSGISVRIVPFSAGAYAGLLGSFVLLTLAEADGDVVFIESLGGELLTRDDEARKFSAYFTEARRLACSDDQASALLARLIGPLDQARIGEPWPPAGLGPPDPDAGWLDLGDARWGRARTGISSLPLPIPSALLTSFSLPGSC